MTKAATSKRESKKAWIALGSRLQRGDMDHASGANVLSPHEEDP